MTDEEIEAAKNIQKTSIKSYINNPDSSQALAAIQLLISAMINQAGSLENLTMINNALIAKFGPLP